MKNNLQNWEIFHLKQIFSELKEADLDLTPENISHILKQTSFEVRSKRYPDRCPYYQKNPPTPCHLEVNDLNCFLCACPEYDNTTHEGRCKMGSRMGKWYYHQALPQGRVWDCSDCPTPHFPDYVEKFLIQNIERLKQESIK
jgi:Zn-finger protein